MVKKSELHKVNLVEDFFDLIDVMFNDNLKEFQNVFEEEKWKVVKK